MENACYLAFRLARRAKLEDEEQEMEVGGAEEEWRGWNGHLESADYSSILDVIYLYGLSNLYSTKFLTNEFLKWIVKTQE